MASSRPIAASPSSAPDGVRERLIQAALGEFARHGVEAASVRSLNRAAGARHQSALYYHFGDKWGLVQAVLDHVMDAMLQRQRAALEALQQPAPRAVVRAMVEPFLELARSADGRERLLLMARLSGQSGAQGQAMIAAKVRPVAELAEAHLQAALPDHTPHALSAKLLYGLNALLHTLADRGMQNFWQLSDVPTADLREYLLDFLEGGLRFDGGRAPHSK